ncbi:MAG: extracellular solute-binding protein [Solirubrobacterales bacterium]|nr:extracellular solute-binding protein [Solirubrobacterales bacterium]
MRSRVMEAALTAAAAAIAVGGCGSSSSGGNGPVTLKLVAADYGTGPKNTSQKYWQSIATAFHRANPKITVKVTTINWNNFDNQVQTMVQNHQFPDITEGDYFSQYAQQGLLYPASQVLSNTGNLLPVFKSQGSYNNTQYGMPFTTSTRTLFYNKKLFAQAHISGPPTTWAQVQADAAKIKALGKIGFGLPLGPEEAQAEALLWFLGDGGGYMKGSNWTINSPQNAAALTFLKGMVNAGDTEPNPATKNRTTLWEQFAAGKIGMINGSPALLPIIKSGGSLGPKDWGSVPIAGKTGALNSTLGVCDNVAAFKQNGHQAAIKKFLDFAYQDKYQLQFVKEYQLLPATTSASNTLKSSPTYGSFFKALPKSVQYPSAPAWAQVKTQIQNQLGTALSGNPSKVLSSIQQVAQKS